jgi:hypothetical protein
MHECTFEVHFMLAQSLSQVKQAYTPDQVREFILGLSFFPALLRPYLTLSNAHNYPPVVLQNYPNFEFVYLFVVFNKPVLRRCAKPQNTFPLLRNFGGRI